MSCKIKFLFSIALFLSIEFSSAAEEIQNQTPAKPAPSNWLQSEVDKWQKIIPLKDPHSKLVNNTGAGEESFYGLRNLRVVLNGVYYRGGANNSYLKPATRDNMNPLPQVGLDNLCQKGFALSYYYYSKNFKTAKAAIDCQTPEGTPHHLEYRQETAQNAETPHKVLKEIHRRIKGEIAGPIYGHCWNGWHASGYIAALALQQFCNRTPEETLNYWLKNTDGNTKGYDKIKSSIRHFQRFKDLEITTEERDLICPKSL